MNKWQRILIAVPAVLLGVGAGEYAMRGTNERTGFAGYLGTELAGVEGFGSNSSGRLGKGGTGVEALANCFKCRAIIANSTGEDGTGVLASGTSKGVSAGGAEVGVIGNSGTGFGIHGTTFDGTGVYGNILPTGTGHAGYFDGRVHVNGNLSKSAGSFKIDHPLDPANKYLYHSFVESPDMKNIYDGVVTLDESGTATVTLPDYFEALNKDFRYQLTCLGEHAPVYVAGKVNDNQFRIAGGYAGLEVSWQVTGIRKDPYAEVHRMAVEEGKPPHEIGRFLNPEVYGLSPIMRVKAAPAQRDDRVQLR